MASGLRSREGLGVTLRRAMWGLTAVALLLSAAYLALAAASARAGWGLPVLWFAGSGFALLLAGLLNVAALRGGAGDPAVRGAWLLGNASMAGFFSLAWSLVKEPQVAIGLVAFGLLAVGAGLTRVGSRA